MSSPSHIELILAAQSDVVAKADGASKKAGGRLQDGATIVAQ